MRIGSTLNNIETCENPTQFYRDLGDYYRTVLDHMDSRDRAKAESTRRQEGFDE